MPDEPLLREQARNAIRKGHMPLRHPDRTWGGPGAGEPCAVCERPITKDQLELEIQFARAGGATPRMDKFHLHIRCFAAWELERTKPGL
jgi:hypothetical protein